MISRSAQGQRFAHSPSPLFWQTAVLLAAAAFRLVMLHDVPPGLAQDEVLNADIVTFIRGGEHALFFRHGFGHEPLYHYFAVPFQYLLGDNILSIRLPAVTLGMLLLAMTMRWVRRDFGWQTAVFTGAGMALSWWPIIFSRIGLRPIMEPLFLVAAVLAWKRPLLAGFLLGLSFYTYTGARIALLIPLIFALAFWVVQKGRVDQRRLLIGDSALNQQTSRHIIQSSVFITLIGTLTALPMQITLWRDPSLEQRINQLSGPLEALQNGQIAPIMQSILATLGVFSFRGDPRWTYMVAERPLFDPLLSLLFYVGLLIAIWLIGQPRFLLLLVWLGVTLIPSAITPQAPSTIRMIGALPVVYLFPAIALVEMVKMTRKKWHISLFSGVLLAYSALIIYHTLTSGFWQWTNAPETRQKYQSTLLDMSRYWQSQAAENSPVVADPFYEPIDADSFRRNLGTDPAARWVQFPAEGGAIVWPDGQAAQLLVPEAAVLPPDLQVQADIPAEFQGYSNRGSSFRVYSLPAFMAPEMETAVLFNNAIQLIGVEIAAWQAERPLILYTYWQVIAPLPWDLTIFIHLLGADPLPVSQHDGFDVAPERLQPGDFVMQRHVLPLPADLQQSYRLSIGLYTSQDGLRWQVFETKMDNWIYKDSLIFDGNAQGE